MTATSPAHRPDVIAIGNAIVDVLAHAPDAFLAEHDMVKGTMALVDDEAAHRIYDAMGPAVEISGGSAANTAAGLASFGARVGFIGKVAGDQLGEVFAHDIRAAGVDFDVPAAQVSDPATGRCLVLVTPDAQRTLNTYLGMASNLGPDDIDVATVEQAKVVYCEGYLWDQPGAKAAIEKAMRSVSDAGGEVAFTLSDPFCVERHRDEFRALVGGHVDILFANEAEISSLYEVDRFEDAAAAVAEDVRLACLTRSELGSVIVQDGGAPVTVPAHPVEALVDTTGAGDQYAAGFLFGYTRGADVADAGRLASLAAAEVISHVGARPERSLRGWASELGLLPTEG